MTEYRQLGAYKLIYEVGYGGMGSVFLAERSGPGRFNKRVAIKTIHPHLARQQAFVDMFLDEARVAGAMSHPNVAQVFDLGEADETLYFAMEYLSGEHLGSVREKVGPLDERHVAHIVSLAARGLHHAHELIGDDGCDLGLVHRDVSPQNIFVTYDGQVKVTDFGIARAAGRLAQETDTGHAKGKCSYMSPEQIASQPLDRRTDVFALGIVMWELLSGKRLFATGNDAETLLRIAGGEVRPLSDFVEVSSELEAIVTKALAHRREERFASAEDLADALDAHLATLGSHSVSALSTFMREHFDEERSAKEQAEREHLARRSTERHEAKTNLDAPDAITPGAPVDAALPAANVTEGSGVLAEPDAAAIGRRWPILAALALLAVVAAFWWGERPAPHVNGSVRVDTQPSGAVVHIDGQQRDGTTPVVVSDLSPGRHRLTLSLYGFEAREVSFDVDRERMELSYRLTAEEPEEPEGPTSELDAGPTPPEGPTAPTDAGQARDAGMTQVRGTRGPRRPPPVMAAPAATAWLSLTTLPWATVTINGDDFGQTSFSDRPVPAGELRLRMRARGTGPVVERTVHIAPGASLREHFRLSEQGHEARPAPPTAHEPDPRAD